MKTWQPELAKFYNEMYTRRQRIAPSIYIFVKIPRLKAHIFMSLI